MAIAFGGTVNGSGSPATISLTTTGSNITLVVMAASIVGTGTVSGVTFNGLSLTQIGTSASTPSTLLVYCFILKNAPATTANIVVNSTAGSTFCAAMYYTGTSATQPDNSVDWQVSAGTISTSITTIADKSWTVMLAQQVAGSQADGTNFKVRETAIGTLGDSNADITPAGSTTITSGVTGAWFFLLSLAPSAAAAANTPISTLSILGVG